MQEILYFFTIETLQSMKDERAAFRVIVAEPAWHFALSRAVYSKKSNIFMKNNFSDREKYLKYGIFLHFLVIPAVHFNKTKGTPF